MKTDTLIVVASLVLGWLLNELSQIIGYRRENKKNMNESIYHLMNLKIKLEEMIPIWDGIKIRYKLNTSEKELVLSLLGSEEITSKQFIETMNKALLDIAKVDPYISLNLKVACGMIELNDAKMVLDSPIDSFKEMIDIKKETLEIVIKSININLKRLLLKKSPLLYLKMIYSNKKDKRHIPYDYSYLFNRNNV
jgi:hypothetical protein